MNRKWVTLFTSSSDALSADYYELAVEIGIALAKANFNLVYGGSRVGLMGKVAETMKSHGSQVVGVIPKRIHEKVPPLDSIDQLILTETMHERKAEMASRGDAFITLPGGFGTLEELLEIITQKQLHYHNKPIVILNYKNTFQGLLNQFQMLINRHFAKPSVESLYIVVESIENAISYIQNYQPPVLQDKWFDTKNGFKVE